MYRSANLSLRLVLNGTASATRSFPKGSTSRRISTFITSSRNWARAVADIYQSAGTVPVNVRDLDLDFATGGSVKWLCGGPGAGYLYVRRDLWPTLQPRVTGWMAHQHPFAFDPEPIEFADNAFRF